MFLEPNTQHSNKLGSIEVICGAMFSGKTEELIRRLNRARLAKQKVEIVKHAIDVRYHPSNVVSHNKNKLGCIPVCEAAAILAVSSKADVIGIDEGQFFDNSLVDICNQLANSGKRVIVAGLDLDYTAAPFGPMATLMSIAEYVTKLHAICMRCGALANYSYRKIADDKLVVLGETDSYEALCRNCYNKGNQ